MNLFGAATSGVDPKTGSYLSKKQRINMFRASRGMGPVDGGDSGASNTGNKKATVAPQSSIVVVNKMAAITQTLQSNYQAATNNISQQVAKNSRDIENLYRIINNTQASELKSEKLETENLRAKRERNRFALREKLVEGLSASVAALATPLKKAADAAMKPIMSFWDKLKRALMLLAAAWVIDNLPRIKGLIVDFANKVGELFNTIKDNPLSIRGIYSAVDGIARQGLKIVGKLVRFSYRMGRAIVRWTFNAFRKIVTAVSDFVTSLGRKLGNALRRAFNAARNLIKPPKPPTPDVPKLPPGGKDGAKQGSKILGMEVPDWMKNTGKWIKDRFKNVKDLMGKGGQSLKNLGGSIKTKATEAFGAMGSKGSTQAAKEGWISRALEPLKKMPMLKGLLKNTKSLAKSMLRSIPLLGMAIDILLNKKMEGQDWTQAIIRGIFSGGAGAFGATGGAKVGMVVGAGLGSVVPVVGTAIGGALGAGLGGLIGSMLAGALGDKVGEITYEKFTGMKAQPNVVTDAITDTAMAAIGKSVDSEMSGGETPKVDVPLPNVTDQSTPEGMNVDPELEAESEVTVTELPPTITKVPTQSQEQPVAQDSQDVDFIVTSDPESNFYRNLAMDRYDLSFAGAF